LNKSWYSHYQRVHLSLHNLSGFETNKDLSAPADGGYTKIYSNSVAFAALKADGSITAWGMVSNDAMLRLSHRF
jgi:hypothetical protein